MKPKDIWALKWFRVSVVALLVCSLFVCSYAIVSKKKLEQSAIAKTPSISQVEASSLLPGELQQILDLSEIPSVLELRNSQVYNDFLTSPETQSLMDSDAMEELVDLIMTLQLPPTTENIITYLGSTELRSFIGSPEFNQFIVSPPLWALLDSPELENVIMDPELSTLKDNPLVGTFGVIFFEGLDLNAIMSSPELESLQESPEVENLLNNPQLMTNVMNLELEEKSVSIEALFLQSFDWPRHYMLDGQTMFESGQTSVVLAEPDGRTKVLSVFMPWETHVYESSNLGVFAYIIRDYDGVYVVDPGPFYDVYTLPSKQKESAYRLPGQVNRLITAINSHFDDINDLKVKEIILTNWHPEHIEIAPALQLRAETEFGYRPPIRIHQEDRLARAPADEKNFGLFFQQVGAEAIFGQAGFSNILWGPALTNNESLGSTGFTVVETPGYTRGSIALKNEALKYLIIDNWAANTVIGESLGEGGCAAYINERGCEIDDPQAMVDQMMSTGCSDETGCNVAGCGTDAMSCDTQMIADMVGCGSSLTGCMDIGSLMGCELTPAEQDIYDQFMDMTGGGLFGLF